MLENNDSVNYYSRWDYPHLCVLYDAQTREIAWCLKKKLNELLLMWGASPFFFLHFLWAWTPDVWDSMMLEKKWMSYYWCEGRPPLFFLHFLWAWTPIYIYIYIYIYLWTIIGARGVPPISLPRVFYGRPPWFYCSVIFLRAWAGLSPGFFAACL